MRIPNRFTKLLACLGVLAASSIAMGQQTRVYVDGEHGTHDGTGSTWGTAYKTIDHAILRSLSSQVMIEEIWIKAGTYKPATKTSTWTFPIGVSVYGGFAGGEASLTDRELDANGAPVHETIISADLAGNDDPGDYDSLSDNATSELFTMGILQPQSPTGSRQSTFNMLVFEGMSWSAGLAVSTSFLNCSETDGPITVSQCIFRNSYVEVNLGPLVAATGSIRFIACVFANNLYVDPYETGFPQSPIALTLTGCDYVESPSVVNCLFAGNTLVPIELSNGSPQYRNIVQNCVFVDNFPLFIGSLYQHSGCADVINCTFTNCHATPDYSDEYPEPPYAWGLVATHYFAQNIELIMSNCVVSDSQSPVFNAYFFDNGAPGYRPSVDRTIEHSLLNSDPVSAIGGGTAGDGVVFGPVEFTNPGGNYFTLKEDSLGIDAGDSTAFHDYVIGPYDYYAYGRYFDIPSASDTGVESPNHPGRIIDMGAVERRCDYCAGDANCDALTNAADFTIVASGFGQVSEATRATGDLSGDGIVNATDFTILAGDFGCDAHPPEE